MRQVDVVCSWVDRWQCYRFKEEWVVEAPLKAVWDGMVHVEEWPVWWEGLELSDSADELPVGMEGKQYSTRWKSPLHYRLEIHAVIRKVSTHDFISADIHGDIQGICTCRVKESRWGTRGFFCGVVRTSKTWMSLFSPFLKGYFTENHNGLMAKGMQGFILYLARGVSVSA